MTLDLFYEDRLIGHADAQHGAAQFVYAREWIEGPNSFSLSVTMPLTTTEVSSEIFLPWAANLLPEADQLVGIGHQLGISPGDTLSLLEAIGRDTAGAVSFGAPGTQDVASWRPIERAADLERIIDELPRKPFLAGDDGVSMSLAGVQSKIAVACDDAGDIYLPLDGSPSTHILKPDSERLWGSVANEAFCLTLARHAGLAVPRLTTGRAGRRSYFLIERYDRMKSGTGWSRLHQEDFCQAMGLPPAAKYERNRTGIKGPTLVDMLDVIQRHGLAQDRLRLLDAAVFNILACNTDAHAKNYSLLIGSRFVSVAPLYDVMCASVFDGVTANLAQTIADKNRGDYLKQRHWLRLAKSAGFGPQPTLRRITALAERVQAAIPTAMADVAAMPAGAEGVDAVAQAIAARVRAILEGLRDREGVDV